MISKPPNKSVIREFFNHKKVATLQDLMDYSQLSHRSIKRRLKELKAYSSYTHNSRYYVLPETPDFNKSGIWKYKGIRFSKYRSLKQSIIALTEQSPGGLSPHELSQLLECPVQPILSTFFKDSSELLRERDGKSYIYFSYKPEVYKLQKQRRRELQPFPSEELLPSEKESLLILVELTKHPMDSLEQLTKRVRRRGIAVSLEQVRNLLQHHDLLKKFWL